MTKPPDEMVYTEGNGFVSVKDNVVSFPKQPKGGDEMADSKGGGGLNPPPLIKKILWGLLGVALVYLALITVPQMLVYGWHSMICSFNSKSRSCELLEADSPPRNGSRNADMVTPLGEINRRRGGQQAPHRPATVVRGKIENRPQHCNGDLRRDEEVGAWVCREYH